MFGELAEKKVTANYMGDLHDPVKRRQRLGGKLSFYHRAAV